MNFLKSQSILKHVGILSLLLPMGLATGLATGSVAEAKLQVVTTTTDLESIVRTVGGDFVEVSSIAKGTQDPHQIEAKPSFMLKFRNADLVVSQGLELESAWLGPLVQGGRNPKINQGTNGFLELGEKLDPIEKPKAGATRAEGDVHPGGNPHFQLDPIRLGEAAVIIGEHLAELDSAHKAEFSKNASVFQKHMQDKAKEWQSRMMKTGIKEVVTYHKTFSYFLDRFGVKSTLQLEPKPGIPPTASHLVEVIGEMKARGIKLVLIENFYDATVSDKIRGDVPNAKVVRLAVSVGGEPEIKNNEDLIEAVVKTFEAAK